MNKANLLLSQLIGVFVGFFVIHPFWISIHAFDDAHGVEVSRGDLLVTAYKHIFSFTDPLETLFSMILGMVIALFVLLVIVRAKRRSRNHKSDPRK